MKTIKIKILTLAIFSASLLTFSGCYTVLWTPEDEMPSERVSDNSGGNTIDGSVSIDYAPIDEYYPTTLYGPYSGYYSQPWWHKVKLPSASHIVNPKGTSTGQTTDTQGRTIRNTENSGIPSANHVSGSGSAGSSTPAPKREERKRDETTNSNTNTKTESSPSRDSNNNSNSLRNSDSNRSTDKGRR